MRGRGGDRVEKRRGAKAQGGKKGVIRYRYNPPPYNTARHGHYYLNGNSLDYHQKLSKLPNYH
jgi:hypothetical protein